ncbi:LVIVD repeat-containing protein [Streptacidiphilus rugosus]|uniref:hypothetical protein n=1 Tax=Streptacidiphilus rugosus TaxID=405783 RepID=UPI00056CDCCE|nr:hypothetical protein [Streptacidiphilus rugosus]
MALDGTVQLWDLTDPRHPVKGARLGTADRHTETLIPRFQNYVSADSAGDLAAVLSEDGRVHLWRLSGAMRATEAGSFPYPDTHGVTTVAVVLPDGKTALVLTPTGFDWWDVRDPAHPVKRGVTPVDSATISARRPPAADPTATSSRSSPPPGPPGRRCTWSRSWAGHRSRHPRPRG